MTRSRRRALRFASLAVTAAVASVREARSEEPSRSSVQTPLKDEARRAPKTADGERESPVSGVAVPVIGYTPETRWQLGAGGALYYLPPGSPKGARASSLTALGMYTTRGQYIFHLLPQFYFDGEDYFVDAELTYVRDADFFWGFGNATPESAQEFYETQGPRVKAGLLRRLPPAIYFGLRTHAEGQKVVTREEGGIIANDPTILGRDGATIAGAGFEFSYDDRDNNLSARKGTYVSFVPMTYSRALGGSHAFVSYTLDARKFFPLSGRHILATEVYATGVSGDVPFMQVPRLGGLFRMRGIYEGRFRDRIHVMTQAEYRFPIYWRFGGAAFVAAGRVASEINEIATGGWKLAAGAGVRFTISEEKRAYFRFDMGFSPEVSTPAVYLTVNEAF